MRPRRIAAALAALACLVATATPTTARAAEIVVFRAGASPGGHAKDLGVDVDRRYTRALRGFAANLTPGQERTLRRDPDVASVIEDRPVRALSLTAAAPGEYIPTGIRRATGAPAGEVHGAATSSVAVLDTGVDLDHPDLNVVAGANCIGDGPPDDVYGHGTHVAGTIAAKDDGEGVVGVAPGTRIVAVKVLDDTGEGTTSSVLCGIEWVLANRAAFNIRVANLSLGGAGQPSTCADDAQHAAYCRLADAGIVPVVAAGNGGWDLGAPPPDVPASYPEVLTVSAMSDTDGLPGGLGPVSPCDPGQRDDVFAEWSSFVTDAADAAHLVTAPGVCVRSTYPGGLYATMSGTSMAAPHVAGLVALCLGEAGAPGPCAGRDVATIIAHMVATATTAAASGSGSAEPTDGRRFGPIAVLPTAPPASPSAPGQTAPPASETPLPAPAQTPPPATEAPLPAPAQTPPPATQTPLPAVAGSPGGAEQQPAQPPRPRPVAAPHTLSPAPAPALLVHAKGALRRLRTRYGLRVRVRVPGAVSGAVQLRLVSGRVLTSSRVVAGRAVLRTRRRLEGRRRVRAIVEAQLATAAGPRVTLRRVLTLRWR